MSRPIVGFLTDFTAVTAPPDVDGREAMAAADAASNEAESRASLLAMAREEGAAEGRRLAEEAAEGRLLRLSDDHAIALEAARAKWAETEGAVLAGRLIEGLATVEKIIADALAAVVTPLIRPAIRQRTIDSLMEALRELMAGNHGAIIEIRGPEDLIDPIRAAEASRTTLVLNVADTVDVTVESADTTIRSQLQAWSDLFEKALLTA